MLSNENDKSKWEITVVGGIPPSVQFPEIGLSKVKKHSKNFIVNLCIRSEDIQSCFESAYDVLAFIGLLKKLYSK